MPQRLATRLCNGLSLTEGVSYGQPGQRRQQLKPGAIRVIPGDPDTSYLHSQARRATRTSSGMRMPRTGGPFLTDGQISIIRRWIELGANNDLSDDPHEELPGNS